MKRKMLYPAAALCCLLTICAQARAPFAITADLHMPRPVLECNISVYDGDVLEFSADDLERRLGLDAGELSGITVTALPRSGQGELVLNGIEVDVGDYVVRGSLDRLCFVPYESATAAAISFLPQCREASRETAAAVLSIQVLSVPNAPPKMEGCSITTVKNVPVRVYVPVTDADGDSVSLLVRTEPKKGSVAVDGLCVTYEPFEGKTGSDSFTICAVDSRYNYSGEAKVSVTIERPRAGFLYKDMQAHPSQYAAIKLHEKKVYTGEQTGGQYLFHPNRQMTRGDFLVLTLTAAGMDSKLPVTGNTGLPNDADIPAWLKPYVKKAMDERILSASQAFWPDEIPTRAEAVVYTCRASKIDDVKDFPLQMGDAASIPEWSRQAYVALSAYRMLDLHDGNAYPRSALTNSYAADLSWQLYKHMHR